MGRRVVDDDIWNNEQNYDSADIGNSDLENVFSSDDDDDPTNFDNPFEDW